MTTAAPILQVHGLTKSFEDTKVLDGIDLSVMPGERIAVLGGSGSGKSTLLRCLNFIEPPSAGSIVLDNEIFTPAMGNRDNARLRTLRRRIGMVFQQFNLFPHKTVLQNVTEALIVVKHMSAHEAGAIARRELARVGMAGRENAYPARLSGGQQQRVAIARALAMAPEIMLFDEPTSSLDPELVSEVLNVIRQLGDEGRTMILVTHELGFAYHFATRIIFLADGRIHEEGTPDQILRAPQRARTRSFLDHFTRFAF